jgi:hypothetical protein
MAYSITILIEILTFLSGVIIRLIAIGTKPTAFKLGRGAVRSCKSCCDSRKGLMDSGCVLALATVGRELWWKGLVEVEGLPGPPAVSVKRLISEA